MKRRPIYTPHVCFACDCEGCERCGGSGYVIGPKSTPVPLADLTCSELNYHHLAKGAAR